ncbi:MAG: DJ-1/PfpI family protein [Spirochaetota bacterium]
MSVENMHVGMMVGPGFEDLEFWAVYMRMQEENARITVIGTEAETKYPSKSGGLAATSEISAADALNEEFDAVLVPGGWAPDKIRRDRHIIEIIRKAYINNKVLGFICHAGLVAASADIVKGKMCTGSMGIHDDMINAGAQWIDEPALQDGNIVWGRVVADIPYYNRLLVSVLAAYGER